jgi:hypothetical protein
MIDSIDQQPGPAIGHAQGFAAAAMDLVSLMVSSSSIFPGPMAMMSPAMTRMRSFTAGAAGLESEVVADMRIGIGRREMKEHAVPSILAARESTPAHPELWRELWL